MNSSCINLIESIAFMNLITTYYEAFTVANIELLNQIGTGFKVIHIHETSKKLKTSWPTDFNCM